jgi:hypothetical protein
MGTSVAALEDAHPLRACVDGPWVQRIDRQRRDARDAETPVRKLPPSAAVEALPHSLRRIGGVDGLRIPRVECEDVRRRAARVEAHVRGAPPAAAVDALEHAAADRGRIHGGEVARVDEERGHLSVVPVAAVRAQRRVDQAPGEPAVDAPDHAGVGPGVDRLRMTRVDRGRTDLPVRRRGVQRAPPGAAVAALVDPARAHRRVEGRRRGRVDGEGVEEGRRKTAVRPVPGASAVATAEEAARLAGPGGCRVEGGRLGRADRDGLASQAECAPGPPAVGGLVQRTAIRRSAAPVATVPPAVQAGIHRARCARVDEERGDPRDRRPVERGRRDQPRARPAASTVRAPEDASRRAQVHRLGSGRCDGDGVPGPAVRSLRRPPARVAASRRHGRVTGRRRGRAGATAAELVEAGVEADPGEQGEQRPRAVPPPAAPCAEPRLLDQRLDERPELVAIDGTARARRTGWRGRAHARIPDMVKLLLLAPS